MPELNWLVIWPILERYPGPLCYIFDTCSAVSAVFEACDGGEFMGASGWDTTAPAEHETLFTRALIQTLIQMRGQNSTLATVYSTLMRDARSANIQVSPVYVSKPHTDSVTIGNTERIGGLAPASVRSNMRVLLSVNIDDIHDQRTLDINFWKSWSPQPVEGMKPGSIKVEAVYLGSLVVLFSIPIEMWAKLSDDPAYTYISHTTSANLLTTSLTELPIYPPRDTKENRPRSQSPSKLFR